MKQACIANSSANTHFIFIPKVLTVDHFATLATQEVLVYKLQQQPILESILHKLISKNRYLLELCFLPRYWNLYCKNSSQADINTDYLTSSILDHFRCYLYFLYFSRSYNQKKVTKSSLVVRK